jgi:hypothetical protein
MAPISVGLLPNRKSRNQGIDRIQVRVIEYTIETDGEPQTYRLITDLLDIERVSSTAVGAALS